MAMRLPGAERAPSQVGETTPDLSVNLRMCVYVCVCVCVLGQGVYVCTQGWKRPHTHLHGEAGTDTAGNLKITQHSKVRRSWDLKSSSFAASPLGKRAPHSS